MTKTDEYLQSMMNASVMILAGTGWTWDDPAWAALCESDLICPNGHKIEIDAPKCHCGKVNPVVQQGLI